MNVLLQESMTLRDRVVELVGHLVPADMVEPTVIVTMSVLKATVIVLLIQVAMLYATWLERKLVGRMQDRLGPTRIGPFGLLVPLADMIKILTKEDITPSVAHRWVYNLAAILIVPPALLGFAVIALDQGVIAADLNVGALFFFAVASTAVIPIFMAGWGSRNKYAVIGAMRAVAQIVSYEIPQVLSLVGVLILAGSLSMSEIITSQGPLPGAADAFPGVWYIFLQPLGFVIFLLATTAEIERTPFDIPEAESEIIAGYHTEYAGIKFGMFYLALYFATIAAAAVGAILFLGGWQPPIPSGVVDWLMSNSGDPEALETTLGSLGWLWMTLKTVLLVMVFMWFRGTLPRLRADQLMGFAWKVLVPISLANLLVTGLVANLVSDLPPWGVLAAFLVANAVLIGALLWLIGWWQRKDAATQISFEPVPGVAAGLPGGSA